jgi:hypothetical protein
VPFLLDHPIILLVVLLALFALATRLGAALRAWTERFDETYRGDFDIVLGAALTLLSLIIGFSFSMAASRYDLRKNFEEVEANAIGTAYARADLLPGDDAARIKQLLREYTVLRVRAYSLRTYSLDYRQQLATLQRETEHAQAQLWSAVVAPAKAEPSPTAALAAASMNEVLDSQGFAQAAAWNRIPDGAWALLGAIGFVAATMVGFRFHGHSRRRALVLVIPILSAISLFLIADIDCPSGGVIRVVPHNLIALQAGMR